MPLLPSSRYGMSVGSALLLCTSSLFAPVDSLALGIPPSPSRASACLEPCQVLDQIGLGALVPAREGPGAHEDGGLDDAVSVSYI
jgi:hypothetical protein